MIQPQTLVRITDNSGGKIARVFKVLGGTRRRYARIGDKVVVSIQVAEPKKQGQQQGVVRKEVAHAVVVRQRKPFRRKDGSYIRFDDNAVVIINKGGQEPRGNRVFGPIPREMGELGYQKIASLSLEIV